MFDKLLPKEEKYFEHFNDMIGHIREMALLTHTLFAADSYDLDLILQIKPEEKRCDEILDKVVRQLNKTFVTPFDREDIFNLIKKLDDISDILLGASLRVRIFQLDEPIPGAKRMTSIIVQQIMELGTAIQDLKDKHNRMNECKAVKDLETEADTVYQQAMTELFERETNAISLMKKKEILDMLEMVADKCQEVANDIIAVFIKNA